MSSSREESPDWLRSFQAPTHVTLSSNSEYSPNGSPSTQDAAYHEEAYSQKSLEVLDIDGIKPAETGMEYLPTKTSKGTSSKKRKDVEDPYTPTKRINEENKQKREGNDDVEAVEINITDVHVEAHVSSSSLPLVLSDKVQRSKALVECEGDSIDLNGDMGAVGRLVISDAPSGNQEMYLDLKGTIYRTAIVPSRTFCIVSFGQSEAKIEAIMNDFIQLRPQSNVYESETMVEGTLDGFSFDSEDEADKTRKVIPLPDQSRVEDQMEEKTKGKVDKVLAARKKGKSRGGKTQSRKERKKTQVSSKARTRK